MWMNNTCHICLLHFHNRERLLNHVRYRSKVCKFNMQLIGPMRNEDEAVVIDSAEAKLQVAAYASGQRRHLAVEPVYRVPGPTIAVLLPPGTKESKHSALGKGRNYF